MPYTSVTIDAARICDWDAFHLAFAEAFGFSDSYGWNMDAWIDCLSYLDAPEERMTTVHAPSGGVLLLVLLHMRDLATRCPEIYTAINDGAAFVNYRKVENGGQPVLCLSFFH